ncbi:MAG: hypothetical protein HY553_14605 [Elusimicrobia bacterium]|nr:hypothetical protein [Elusimicrobiota bacterium]
MTRSPNVTWHTARQVPELDAWLIATLLRLLVNDCKPAGERDMTTVTALTEERAEEIAGALAYFKTLAASRGVIEVDRMIDLVAGSDEEAAEAWADAHEKEVQAQQRSLLDLVGKFTAYG